LHRTYISDLERGAQPDNYRSGQARHRLERDAGAATRLRAEPTPKPQYFDE
jgi:hypothetical protein